MKNAVIRGKLDDFVSAAVWMAEHQLSADLPAAWKDLANAAHTTANRARTTETKEQGKVFGAMIATCAGCHDKLGLSLKSR